MEPALNLLGITKSFPAVIANDDITFKVDKSSIHGLLGENGAGKTVLMSTLYGLYKPDLGKILIDGNEVQINSPSEAMELGIGMVHQHFMLVPSLTVVENIILGNEPIRNGLLLDYEKMYKKVSDFCSKYKLEVDLEAPIFTLPVGVQQRVEILKALYRGAEILILDEPTSVLTPNEVEELFTAMRALKQEGKTVIFISHKLKEVLAICDKITILKRGKVIGTMLASQTNEQELADMMVGRKIINDFKKKQIQDKNKILLIRNLKVYSDRGILALNNINLDVYSHEILGIAGVEGNGQTELVEALTGIREIYSGSIELCNKDITKATPDERIKLGISHIPEDRHKRGIIEDFSVLENLILGSQREKFSNQRISLNFDKASNYCTTLIDNYSIQTPNQDTPIKFLSGGNQQRVVVAREFSRLPILVISAQPTRGLDVGASEYVRRKLIEMRDNGSAILLISADLNEIWNLSDRIGVIFNGNIVDVKNVDETTESEIGLLMAGGEIE
jgi:simple sugar transport system ATP-binding protein